MKKSASLPTILNKNVSFIDNPLSWVFYVSLFIIMRVVLAGFGISSKIAWTIVNWTHGLTTFFLFHWIKGSPFVDDHGQYSQMTFWEQIDDQIQYTRARKFLTIMPIILFLVSADSAGWDLAYFWINLLCCAILLIAKLPIMHKVRIFGINA
ncbi:ORM1-like protein 3 [Histomonas meleagridis]|uniref:ORM1-like protein 3 n=1 Tax=Histomonas meleagridis TaxID=135588 RepID=UPI003559F2BF|nr:ORM1-like protein 3 [Histomonas meleagridis]KAH0803350.1 ORM1-like protein 3 [Histomonas meleagridis]